MGNVTRKSDQMNDAQKVRRDEEGRGEASRKGKERKAARKEAIEEARNKLARKEGRREGGREEVNQVTKKRRIQ